MYPVLSNQLCGVVFCFRCEKQLNADILKIAYAVDREKK